MSGLSVIARPLRLFISHSWDHEGHRDGLADLISAEWMNPFSWIDLSVPKDNPLHVRGDMELETALRRRIAASDAVLAFAGIYSSRSDWIEFEVKTAWAQFKPIIAVRPRAQHKLSRVVTDRAAEIVGWNGNSARNAILKHLPEITLEAVLPRLRRSELVTRTLAARTSTGSRHLNALHTHAAPRSNGSALNALSSRARYW